LVLWPAAAMPIVGGTTLVVSAFLDANQMALSPSSQLPSATSATDSRPIPDIAVTDGTHVSVGAQEVLLGDNASGLQSMPSEGIGLIENRAGRVRLLLGAGSSTYLVEGTDVQHLTALPRLVLGPGSSGEFDNGAAQVFAVVRSDDLLKWSSQVKLVSGYAQRVLGRAVALAPTILFDPDDKPSGWLIYAYSPKLTTPKLANLGTPTYMVGRKISFAKKP